ncbi:hypothetical protein BB560_007231, partial [Smittium megazygosporum]
MSSLLENPSVAPIDKFCLSGLDLSCSDLTAAEIAQNVASKLGDYFNSFRLKPTLARQPTPEESVQPQTIIDPFPNFKL